MRIFPADNSMLFFCINVTATTSYLTDEDTTDVSLPDLVHSSLPGGNASFLIPMHSLFNRIVGFFRLLFSDLITQLC